MAVRYSDDTLWSQVAIGPALAPHESFDVFSGTVREADEPVEVWLMRPAALGSLTPESVLEFLDSVDEQAADSMDVEPPDNALVPLAFGLQSGRVFAVYPAGPPPLSTLIDEGASLNPAQAVTIITGAMDTLGELTHPGLTTRNILVADDGSVHVTEFGFPVLLPAPVMPFSPEIPESAYVAAPERIVGAAASEPVQIYAAGALLYWLLTGRPPFRGDTAGELYSHHRDTLPPLLVASHPELSPELGLSIDRALSKAPGQRFKSLYEMEGALRGGMYPGSASPDLTQQVPALAPSGTLDTSTMPAFVPDERTTPDEPLTAVASQPSRSYLWLFLLALLLLPLGAFLAGGALVAGDVVPNVFNPNQTPPTIAVVTATPVAGESPTVEPTTGPAPSATPVASPTPAATPEPTATPIPAASPTPVTPGASGGGSGGGTGGGAGGGSGGASGGGTVATFVSQASACWDSDWPCVIRNLERANALEPSNTQVSNWLVQSYVNYGLMLVRGRNPVEGLPWLDKAVKRDPAQRSVILAALLEPPDLRSPIQPVRGPSLPGLPRGGIAR